VPDLQPGKGGEITMTTIIEAELDHLIRTAGARLESLPLGGCVAVQLERGHLLRVMLYAREVPVAIVDLSGEPIAIWSPKRRRKRVSP
jgi:hypothetical protein